MKWSTPALDDGPTPLWSQIADRLRRAIETGAFAPGNALPSESELNRAFGVSRTTARAALDKLRNEGLITRGSGKGSIVLAPRVEQPLSRLSGFAEDMRRRGHRASYETRTIRRQPASREIATALGVEASADVLYIARLLEADGAAIGLSRSWIPMERLGRRPVPTLRELDETSLYDWLERRCGVRIAGGSETIEAQVADGPLADTLSMRRGAAVLVARRRSIDAGGAPIEYVVIAYRGDRYRFSVDGVPRR